MLFRAASNSFGGSTVAQDFGHALASHRGEGKWSPVGCPLEARHLLLEVGEVCRCVRCFIENDARISFRTSGPRRSEDSPAKVIEVRRRIFLIILVRRSIGKQALRIAYL